MLRNMRSGIFVGVIFSLVFAGVSAFAEGEKELQTATYFTQMLVTAREVISRKQDLLNDASLGDKGFDKESFNKHMKVMFFRLYGKNLLEADAPQEAFVFLQILEEVITEAQPDLNKKGVGFKNFIPAIFIKKVSKKFQMSFAGTRMKLTSIPDVHNPENAPDDWEKKILEYFLNPDYQKGHAYSEVVGAQGKKTLRLLQPE